MFIFEVTFQHEIPHVRYTSSSRHNRQTKKRDKKQTTVFLLTRQPKKKKKNHKYKIHVPWQEKNEKSKVRKITPQKYTRYVPLYNFSKKTPEFNTRSGYTAHSIFREINLKCTRVGALYMPRLYRASPSFYDPFTARTHIAATLSFWIFVWMVHGSSLWVSLTLK